MPLTTQEAATFDGPGLAYRPSKAGAVVRSVQGRLDERLSPEDFGAIGDGVANDAEAFARLSAHLTTKGGGTVDLRAGAVYLVGRQTLAGAPGGLWAHIPTPVIQCFGGTKPIVVNGNGATLRCAPGLKYGVFDAVTGAKAVKDAPGSARSTPYEGMLHFRECRGSITVRDLELDGSSASLIVGGEHGDTGRQIPACGILMEGNSGLVLVENVHAHHHAWDGWLLNHVASPVPKPFQRSISATNFHADYNGRQGLSLTGGHGATFTGCAFNYTGTVYNPDLKAPLISAPASGVDIEAEAGQSIRRIAFDNCEIIGNAGAGLLASVNDAEDIVCRQCLFIGTQAPAIYNSRAYSRYYGCKIVGQVITSFDDPSGVKSPHYHDCTFTDDAAESPDGRVYAAGGNVPLIEQLGEGALYNRCVFRVVNGYRLPATRGNTRYIGITASGTNGSSHYMRGHYFGSSVVDTAGAFFGPYDDAGVGSISGKLTVNGVVQKALTYRDAGGYTIPPGASASGVVAIPQLRPGDTIIMTPNVDLGGLLPWATFHSNGNARVNMSNPTVAALKVPDVTFTIRAVD